MKRKNMEETHQFKSIRSLSLISIHIGRYTDLLFSKLVPSYIFLIFTSTLTFSIKIMKESKWKRLDGYKLQTALKPLELFIFILRTWIYDQSFKTVWFFRKSAIKKSFSVQISLERCQVKQASLFETWRMTLVAEDNIMQNRWR